ncbi:MAG: DUF1015 family protein [Candidatus Limnocylindria bacterium]
MPTVRPFAGLGYALDRYGTPTVPERVRLPNEPPQHPGRVADLTDVACPPYDVISDAQRDELLERDAHNAVRLELNPDAEDPHAAAVAELHAWIAAGVLERRSAPSVYYYSFAARPDSDQPMVHAVLSRVLLEPWGGGVRPHEHTMPGPKAERLGLLRATRTQLSPILVLYFDRSERYRHVMSRPWTDEWRACDADGLLHQVAAVDPDERLLNYLSRQRLFVADGHHRYETALAHQADVRADTAVRDLPLGALAADWVMAVLVNAQQEELRILPTHRLLRAVDPAPLARSSELFDAEPMPLDELPARLEATPDDTTLFGLVLPGGRGWLLVGRPDAIAERMRSERGSTAFRRLDLAVLHAALLRDALGIDEAAVTGGRQLLYTRSAPDAIERVQRGEVKGAVLVRPTRLEQLAAVANAGDVMPHKSTYFHPKLLTGMVFNPLED